MALEFCEHEDVVFEHAPLIRVLCQIRFPPVLSLLSVAGVTGFQTAIRHKYATMLPPEQNTTIEFTPNQVGVEKQAPVWRFVDESGAWTVGLCVDFVSIETPTYSHIDEFLDRFSEVLSVLHRTVRPAASLRIGMRKVNMIEAPGVDTGALVGKIRPELLGPLAADRFPAPIQGCFSQLMFQDEDNQLVVRFGLAPNEEAQEDASVRFVIDQDYFTERPHDVDGADSLVDLLRYFSDGMTSFFHWALEDAYKVELGPRARSEVREAQ